METITTGEIGGILYETVTIDAGTGATSVGVIGNSTEIGDCNWKAQWSNTLKERSLLKASLMVQTLATGAISVTTADDAITFNHLLMERSIYSGIWN